MFLALELGASHIAAAVIGGLVSVFIERLLTKSKGGMTCSSCGAALPERRKPASLRQALRGGWTCPACGVELDRKGQPRG